MVLDRQGCPIEVIWMDTTRLLELLGNLTPRTWPLGDSWQRSNIPNKRFQTLCWDPYRCWEIGGGVWRSG